MNTALNTLLFQLEPQSRTHVTLGDMVATQMLADAQASETSSPVSVLQGSGGTDEHATVRT